MDYTRDDDKALDVATDLDLSSDALQSLWAWSRTLRDRTLDARIASMEARAHANDLRLRASSERKSG